MNLIAKARVRKLSESCMQSFVNTTKNGIKLIYNISNPIIDKIKNIGITTFEEDISPKKITFCF